MDESLQKLADACKTEYRRKRQWQIVVIVLCLVAALCTAYALSTPAITVENAVYCGLEEHVGHGASCFDAEGDLVCTKEIHTHSLQCFSDPAADAETAEDWERTVNCAVLSGDKGADAAAIAMTQLGYSESERNYEVYDGTSMRGYTRYGEWYGDPYMDWDSVFCAFCYSYAGVTRAEMPTAPDSESLLRAVRARGLFADGTYIPKAGDLIFIRLDGDGCRVGMVTATTLNADGNLEGITSVDGDFENAVRQNTRPVSDESILGYGVLKDKTQSGAAPLTASTGVTSASGLATNGNAKNGDFVLQSNITINSTISVNSGTSISIDLRGKKISGSANPMFRLNGGTLRITDSTSPTVSTTETQGNEFGKTASYANNKLTYYVTKTAVTDESVGATSETTVKYEVSPAGMISVSQSKAFEVNSGTLEINGGMIVGNQSGRAIDVNGGTLRLAGGYICNFKTSDDGGAVKQSGGTVNVSGSVLAANVSESKGGAISVSGGSSTLNISGGAIAGNTAKGEGGGGVNVGDSAKINLSGGYITNNHASAAYYNAGDHDGIYKTGGGGILLESKAELTITGGYITSNLARGGGGGIKTRSEWNQGSQGRVIMNGGFVTANNSLGAEGGGININAFGSIEITKGYITNNMAGTGLDDKSFIDWGGGGIFCAQDSASSIIMNSLITNNSAGGFGGGVAGCATGRIITSDSNGTAIFDNSAEGENTSGSGSAKHEDHHFAKENPVFMSHGYEDYFCALASKLTGSMLGGGEEKWTGTSDGVPVSTESKTDTIIGGYVTGLTSRASEEDKVLAENVAQVFINGNISPTHGGGVLTNGYLIMGSVDSVDVYCRLELNSVRKQFYDESGNVLPQTKDAFRFVVVDKFGAVVSEGTNSADGTIEFDRMLPFTDEGVYTYELYEVPPDDSSIQQDTSKYSLTVTVSKRTTNGDNVPWTNIPIVRYEFSNVRIVETTGGDEISNGNPGNDEAHAVKIDPTGNREFVNRSISTPGGGGGGGGSSPTVSVKVTKSWTDGSRNKSGVTVKLLKDGEQVGSAVLSGTNGWSYTWTGLDADAVYTVQENAVNNYIPSYDYTYSYDSTQVLDPFQANGALLYVKSGSYYVRTNSFLTDNKYNQQYIISSSDGTKLLRITGAHNDHALDAGDTYSVSRDNTNDRFSAAGIPADCIFKLRSTTKDGYTYDCLANTGVTSFLLVQDADGNYLKGANSADWSSSFKMESGKLMGQREWGRDNEWRYVIFEGSKFNTATKIIYPEIIGVIHKNYTVTNTPQAQVTYSLSIRKYEAGNTELVLPGAEFELRNGNAALKFKYVSPGHYTYDTGGSVTKLTTATDGYIRINGLPAGTYTLRETRPPNGYLPAADRQITLNEEMPTRSLEVQVADGTLSYTLPETGGAGIHGLYLAGASLMAFSLISFIRLYRKKR